MKVCEAVNLLVRPRRFERSHDLIEHLRVKLVDGFIGDLGFEQANAMDLLVPRQMQGFQA